MGLFTENEQELISKAISDAEKATSGEIRIALEKHCSGDSLEKAASMFIKLGMDKTTRHNGVLIYIAVEDHKFAIIGDKGIDKVVPADFWEMTKSAMRSCFIKGDLIGGILTGISLAGEQLSAYFPSEKDDVNELPNDIIFMDKPKDSGA